MCITNGNRCIDPEPTIEHILGICGRGQERIVEARSLQNITRKLPTESTKQDS